MSGETRGTKAVVSFGLTVACKPCGWTRRFRDEKIVAEVCDIHNMVRHA